MTLRTLGQRNNTQLLLSLMIVTGVLGLSMVIPRLPAELMVLAAAALPAAAFGLYLLRYTEWAILLIIPAGLLIPFTVGTGTGTSLHAGIGLAAAVIGLWLVRMVIVERHFSVRIDWVTLPLLCFGLLVLLSFLAGQINWFPIAGAPLTAQIGAVAVFMLSIGTFLATAHLITDEVWLKRIVWVFLAIGAAYIAYRLLPVRPSPLGTIFRPGNGADGSVFWIWLVALAAGQALLNRDLRPVIRLGLAGLMGATLLVGLTQGRIWASGWLPPMVALTIILWVWKPRIGWVFVAGGGVWTLVNLERLLQVVSSDFELGARMSAWQVVLDATRPSLFLGLGPANYYYYVELFTIFGWNQGWNVRFNSHSQYIDIIAQLGIVGLVAFLWFAIALLFTGYQLSRRVTGGFARGYVAACIGGIVATLFAGFLGDWFLPFVYNVGIKGMRSSLLFWIFTGGMMALAYMQIDQESEAHGLEQGASSDFD